LNQATLACQATQACLASYAPPLPIATMIPSSFKYNLCIEYFDQKHLGKYQSILCLVKDQNGVNRCYFVNEKGHPSGFHGTWRLDTQVVDGLVTTCVTVCFHCLGTRGPERTLVFAMTPDRPVLYRRGQWRVCAKLECIAPKPFSEYVVEAATGIRIRLVTGYVVGGQPH